MFPRAARHCGRGPQPLAPHAAPRGATLQPAARGALATARGSLAAAYSRRATAETLGFGAEPPAARRPAARRYQASRDDLAVYVAFSAAPAAATYPHLARWYSHISALLGNRCALCSGTATRRRCRRGAARPDAWRLDLTRGGRAARSFPGKAVGVSVGGAAAAPAAPAAAGGKPAAKPAAGSDDSDEELDLFGDETPEEAAAKEKKAAAVAEAKKRSSEKALLSKSMIVLDVKPWDDETDMAALEKHVRSVEKDGLLWGASKLVPVGFGIKKLQITAVILDAKVPSFDAIIEDDLVQDGENEWIQSADIAAFNKL